MLVVLSLLCLLCPSGAGPHSCNLHFCPRASWPHSELFCLVSVKSEVVVLDYLPHLLDLPTTFSQCYRELFFHFIYGILAWNNTVGLQLSEAQDTLTNVVSDVSDVYVTHCSGIIPGPLRLPPVIPLCLATACVASTPASVLDKLCLTPVLFPAGPAAQRRHIPHL